MSQRSIYEYDVKKLFAQYTDKHYDGKEITDIDQLDQLDVNQTYVIKPDHLFGKRGKHGLVWINLWINQLKQRFSQHYDSLVTIDSTTGSLTRFMVEPCIAHDQEYYIACSTTRDCDIIYFSTLWGVDVEEQWDTIKSVNISPLDSLDATMIQSAFGITDQLIIDFIASFVAFFRAYWFTYLEVNPFVFDHLWQIHCLDMVAKIDDCEQFNQRAHRGDLSIPLPFGGVEYEAESTIRELDEKTGASLKCTIINPNGSIWLILWGWWASLCVRTIPREFSIKISLVQYVSNIRMPKSSLIQSPKNSPDTVMCLCISQISKSLEKWLVRISKILMKWLVIMGNSSQLNWIPILSWPEVRKEQVLLRHKATWHIFIHRPRRYLMCQEQAIPSSPVLQSNSMSDNHWKMQSSLVIKQVE